MCVEWKGMFMKVNGEKLIYHVCKLLFSCIHCKETPHHADNDGLDKFDMDPVHLDFSFLMPCMAHENHALPLVEVDE